MNLVLFSFLFLVAITLIIIGLTRPTESAQALIGFTFMFLLAIVIINGALRYEVGAVTNTTFTYDGSNRVNFSSQEVAYQYENFSDTTSHRFGYYLAIASVIGFIGIILSLKTGGVGPNG